MQRQDVRKGPIVGGPEAEGEGEQDDHRGHHSVQAEETAGGDRETGRAPQGYKTPIFIIISLHMLF